MGQTYKHFYAFLRKWSWNGKKIVVDLGKKIAIMGRRKVGTTS